MMIAVVDYGIGNLRSAEKALQHLGADARLTSDARRDRGRRRGGAARGRQLRRVHARAARERPRSRSRVDAATDGRPFLGICVGMQMLFDGSDESPDVDGLGVVAGRITRLPDTVRLPQMGWNTLEARPGARLVAGPARPRVVLLRAHLRARARPTTRSWPPGATTAGASRPRSSAGRCGPRSSTPRRAARSAWRCSATS